VPLYAHPAVHDQRRAGHEGAVRAGQERHGGRAEGVGDPKVAHTIGELKGEAITGKYDFTSGPVKNVALAPDLVGQWRLNSSNKFDLVVVDNSAAPDIPIQGDLHPPNATGRTPPQPGTLSHGKPTATRHPQPWQAQRSRRATASGRADQPSGGRGGERQRVAVGIAEPGDPRAARRGPGAPGVLLHAREPDELDTPGGKVVDLAVQVGDLPAEDREGLRPQIGPNVSDADRAGRRRDHHGEAVSGGDRKPERVLIELTGPTEIGRRHEGNNARGSQHALHAAVSTKWLTTAFGG